MKYWREEDSSSVMSHCKLAIAFEVSEDLICLICPAKTIQGCPIQWPLSRLARVLCSSGCSHRSLASPAVSSHAHQPFVNCHGHAYLSPVGSLSTLPHCHPTSGGRLDHFHGITEYSSCSRPSQLFFFFFLLFPSHVLAQAGMVILQIPVCQLHIGPLLSVIRIGMPTLLGALI